MACGHDNPILLKRKPNHRWVGLTVQNQCLIVEAGVKFRYFDHWKSAHNYIVLEIFSVLLRFHYVRGRQ